MEWAEKKGMGLIKMKALSIKHPWAWLIVHGYKDIENRTWSTSFRGRFLIHAGQAFDWIGYKWLAMNHRKLGLIDLPSPASVFYCKGGIVGGVELIDCVTMYDSPWFFGPYGFILQNACETKFYPFKGKLRFFEVSEAEGQPLLAGTAGEVSRGRRVVRHTGVAFGEPCDRSTIAPR